MSSSSSSSPSPFSPPFPPPRFLPSRPSTCTLPPSSRSFPRHLCLPGDSSPPRDDWHPPHPFDSPSLLAAASRIGDPFRDLLTLASKRLQDCFDSCKSGIEGRDSDPSASDVLGIAKPSEEKWDWDRWQKHFSQIEEQERIVSVLKFELDSAVREEDFKEAARLKMAIDEATANDTVSEVISKLRQVLESEHFEEAKQLRDGAAAGLVGWWVGLAEGESDPYGRIIKISPSHGRFIAKGYTARQLANSGSGIPLFEIFVRKDDNGYHQQAVLLRQGSTRVSASRKSDSAGRNSDGNARISSMNVLTGAGRDSKGETSKESFIEDNSKIADEKVSEDGLERIIEYLKDRIPDVKLKVFRMTSGTGEDVPKIVEKILEEAETHDSEGVRSEVESSNASEDVLQGRNNNKANNDGGLIQEMQRELPVRLVVGGTLQNGSQEKLPKAITRVPARVESRSRDSFLLHIEEDIPQVHSLQVPSSSDITSEASDVDKIPVEITKDIGELLRFAVSQVQRRHGLTKCTSFERIKLLDSDTDPLTGLYIGSFGPFTSELVQLRRKYGHWNNDTSINSESKIEFFEYVEAVKLTGDLNVPAGQVTFRARIGKGSRLAHRGIYPEELGVIARYKGQGMLAEPGFKNPQWVDGELLLLDGKSFGHLNGAELGFVYSVPDRHFLVLFNRVKLQVPQ